MVETKRIWPVKNSFTITVKQFWLASFMLLMIVNTAAAILLWLTIGSFIAEQEGVVRFFFLGFLSFLFVEVCLLSLYFARGKLKRKNERLLRMFITLILWWNNAVFALLMSLFLIGIGLAKIDMFVVVVLVLCGLAVIGASGSIRDAKAALSWGVNEKISL